MDKITAAVMAILGTDAVALSGDDVTNADEVATKLQAFALDKNKLDEFVAATRGALALSADTDLTTIQGTIIANKEQAGKLAEVTEERDALALSVETAKHSDLLTTAKAEGKIVGEQMEAWAKGLNSVALSAFLDTAPVIVEPKKIVKDEENDAVALSGDTEFYAQHGLTLEQVNQHGGQ